jgi:hypothetical protein
MAEVCDCDYCHQPILNSKPFVPVNTKQKFHWKCYIKKAKEHEVSYVTYEEPDYSEVYLERVR